MYDIGRHYFATASFFRVQISHFGFLCALQQDIIHATSKDTQV